MDLFSHILWTYVPTKNKMWRDEALFFALLPDLGFLLILLYVFFGTPSSVGMTEALRDMPSVLLNVYYLLHSFVTFGIVAVIIWKLRPKLLPAMIGWFIHIVMDIPFHEGGTFATRFIYPISGEVYVSGVNWFDWRVLGLSYLALLIVYIYTIRRENKKHRRGDDWKPDWIDKLNAVGEALINRKPIPTIHAAGQDIEGAPDELSGEDGEGFGQGEDLPAGAVLHQEGG